MTNIKALTGSIVFLPILFILFLTSSALGYSLKKITVTGSARIAEADIIKATGLRSGSTITADDLKKAADRLTQSGVFGQVNYKFDGESVEYTVADADQFVPAVFENFVWFTDADLGSYIRNLVPLFTGVVALSGNLPDQVCAALDSLLKEKGIPGQTVATPNPAIGDVQAVQFRVAGVNVQIAEISFSGATPDRLPLLQAATKNLIGSIYMKSSFAQQVRQSCLRVYGRLGLLKAQFGVPQIELVLQSSVQPTISIKVSIQEGDPYSYSAADWTGNKAISAAELTKLIDLKAGAEADSVRLAGDIAAAKDLYGTRGFMNAQVKSSATLDGSNHTAVFHLEVQEDPLYHMGKLQTQDLDPQLAELVRRVWELHEGDVYDASYPKVFLKKHPHELQAMNG
jgi:outer membrane protein assembly factor BamA